MTLFDRMKEPVFLKESSDAEAQLEKLRELWANSYLELHKEVKKDYTGKYEQYKVSISGPKEIVNSNVEDTDIFKELKAYRLDKSREEKIKPYFIYNDKQLKDLITKMPRTVIELQKIEGFGEIKANKYGTDIIKIVSKYISS